MFTQISVNQNNGQGTATPSLQSTYGEIHCFRPKERCRENGDSGTEKGVRGKRALEEEEDGNSELLSKNKQKKKLRNPNKSFDPSLKRKFHLLA